MSTTKLTVPSKTLIPGSLIIRYLKGKFDAQRYLPKLALGFLQFNAAGEIAATDSPVVAGSLTLGTALIDSVQRLSGAGAVNLTTITTALTTTGAAQALTLANGVDGQTKTIIHDVDGGSAVLTPTTKTGFSTITFTNVGDAVTLKYLATRGWYIVALQGAVAA